jgi:hypothetical protein
MNASIKRALYFPMTKITIGIGVGFSLFVGIQNFVSKPFFYSIISDKGIADALIHCVSVIVLLLGYYYLFRFLNITTAHNFLRLFGLLMVAAQVFFISSFS